MSLPKQGSTENVTETDEKVGLWKKLLSPITNRPTSDDIEYAQSNNVSMTSRKELFSWYLYDAANSPYVALGLGLVFPTVLTYLATEEACKNTTYGCDYNNNSINSNEIARIKMGNWKLRPTSYTAVMISLSGLFQGVVYITTSSLGDRSNYQYYLFRITSIIGIFFGIFWIFFSSSEWWLFAGFWGSIGIIFLGLSIIFYNGYLPILVENHWLSYRAIKQGKSLNFISSLQNTLSDDISQYGYCCGFLSTLFAILIGISIFLSYPDNTIFISKKYGLNKNKFDNIVINNDIDKSSSGQELWMKKIKYINFYILNNYNNTNISYICSMQMYYNKLNLSGKLFGSSTCGNIENEVNNTNIIYYRYYIPNKDYINKINIWLNKNDKVLNGLQFETNKNNKSIIYGNNNMNITNKKTLDESSFNFELAGYSVSTGYYINNNLSIITGIQFGFMSHKYGQYSSLLGSRLVMVFVCLWWLLFSIPSFKYLQNRPGEALPKEIVYDPNLSSNVRISITQQLLNERLKNIEMTNKNDKLLINSSSISNNENVSTIMKDLIENKDTIQNENDSEESNEFIVKYSVNIFTYSSIKFYVTLKEARKLPELFKYLIAYFMWSDGFSTIAFTGILFAIEVLGMTSNELFIVALEIQLSAVIGAFIFLSIQKKLLWNSKDMLLLHLCIIGCMPIYSIFGLFDIGFGLVSKTEMYVFVFLFGLNIGSTVSYSRSLLGLLTPVGRENEIFSLYEITDKGSSWIGPLLVAIISNNYSMRWGLFYLILFFVIPIPLIKYFVNLEKGLKESGRNIKQNQTDSIQKSHPKQFIDSNNSQNDSIY